MDRPDRFLFVVLSKTEIRENYKKAVSFTKCPAFLLLVIPFFSVILMLELQLCSSFIKKTEKANYG